MYKGKIKDISSMSDEGTKFSPKKGFGNKHRIC